MRELTGKQKRFVEEYSINIERFWSFIDKTGGPDTCWNWNGAKDDSGYGRFHVGKSRNSAMLAHRIAYGIATGDKPEAVCHKCDNPSCCNPSHLEGGTRLSNNQDMTRKRRHWAHVDPSRSVKGEKHGQAKLLEKQVIEIKKLYATGKFKQRELATQFGVCQRTINKIVNSIGWKNVKVAHS